MLGLILGLYQPISGQVRHYGQVLDEYSFELFRYRFAYLPQETYLLNMTIQENLMWTKPEASESDFELVLAHAEAAGFVSEFEVGM